MAPLFSFTPVDPGEVGVYGDMLLPTVTMPPEVGTSYGSGPGLVFGSQTTPSGHVVGGG